MKNSKPGTFIPWFASNVTICHILNMKLEITFGKFTVESRLSGISRVPLILIGGRLVPRKLSLFVSSHLSTSSLLLTTAKTRIITSFKTARSVMASSFIAGAYQSYKAGTGKVLHWLYENAVKCGYEWEQTDDGGDGNPKPSTEPKKRPEPEPKSKKGKGSKAKGSGQAKSKKASTASESTRYVSVNELPALAETSKYLQYPTRQQR
jgi:hypothetical protein